MTVRGATSLCVFVLLLLSICVPVPAGAQTSAVTIPARDRSAAEPPSGTAVLRGRVVSADGSSPLRRAQVRVSAAAPRMMRLASTDAEGRYEFTNLPAGRYTVTVNKAGFVGLEFGQRRPFEGGRPLDVADDQVVENIDFALPPGGVITGRITDEGGDPIIGAYVQAMRYSYMPGGRRQLVGVNSSYLSNISNDLGEFRLFGLMPGTYVVSAYSSSVGVLSNTQTGPQTAGIASTDVRDTLIHTYFPGTANIAEARSVVVNLSEEAHASFALVSGRAHRITGFVRRSDGAAASGSEIQLRPNDSDGPALGGWGMSAIAPDGAFSFANVPPGQYFLEVFPTRGTVSPEDAARPGAAPQEFARTSATVGGADITGLSIVTRPAVSASGRVIFPRPGLKNADGTPVRINAVPADPSQRGRVPMTSANNGVIDESGRFQIRGIVGQVLFRNGMLPPGFGVKSVRLNGADITDQPYDASDGDVSGLEIVIGELAQVDGIARNARGDLMKDFKVALYPAGMKPSLRTQRFMVTATADPNGRFQVRLPEGGYLVVAVESFDRGEEWDPAFQQRVLPGAKRFVVKEGQTVTVDVPYVE